MEDQLPFQKNLSSWKNTRGFEYLEARKVKNGCGKIVRDLLPARGSCCFSKNQKKHLNHLLNLVNLLRKLKSVYGIQFKAQFIIGKDQLGKTTVYALIDWIYGRNLKQMLASKISAEQRRDLSRTLDTHYWSLARYLYDQYTKDRLSWFLSDIVFDWQYLYGYASGGQTQKKKLFLVDLELYHAKVDQRRSLESVFDGLIYRMRDYNTDHHFAFTKTRRWFINHPDPKVASIFKARMA